MTSSDHRPRSRLSRLALLAALAVAAAGLATLPTPVAAGDILSYYADSKTTSGDGTYYWTTDWGQCSLVPRPPNARGRQGVALNARQWRELGESAFCGMCVTVDGSGSGRGADPIRGTYDAYVMDHCSSCTGGSWGGYGDLDFSDGGKDGRWDITWRAVPCPVEGPIEYVFVGSHKWYIKVRDVGATRGTVCGGGAADGGGGVAGERRGYCFGGGGKREWVCAATTVWGSTVDSAPLSLLLTCSSSVHCVVLRSRCVGDETLTSPSLPPVNTPPCLITSSPPAFLTAGATAQPARPHQGGVRQWLVGRAQPGRLFHFQRRRRPGHAVQDRNRRRARGGTGAAVFPVSVWAGRWWGGGVEGWWWLARTRFLGLHVRVRLRGGVKRRGMGVGCVWWV